MNAIKVMLVMVAAYGVAFLGGMAVATANAQEADKPLLAAAAPVVIDAGPSIDAGAEAAPAAPLEEQQFTEENPFDAATAAGSQGVWLAMIAAALVAIVAFVRREKGWLATTRFFGWFGTDRGGAVLVVILGVVAEVAVTLKADSAAPPGTVATLTSALAAGGRVLLKSLFAPHKE